MIRPPWPGRKFRTWAGISFNITHRPPHLNGVAEDASVYFVHSYYPVPDDPAIIATTTEYGLPFASSVWSGNIFATQFHPEKSQAIGLQILANFGQLVREHRPGSPSRAAAGSVSPC